MSYNCNIEMKADIATLEIIKNGLSDLKEAQQEIFNGELISDFREDCSGEIYELARKHSLSFSYIFYGEDELEEETFFKNGQEIDWKEQNI